MDFVVCGRPLGVQLCRGTYTDIYLKYGGATAVEKNMTFSFFIPDFLAGVERPPDIMVGKHWKLSGGLL